MRGIGFGLGAFRTLFASLAQSTSDPANTNDINAGYFVGQKWINTATLNEFTCVSNAAGAAVWRHTPRILGQSRLSQTAITGDTNEHVIVTVPVQANALGAKGLISVETIWTITNSANSKVLRVRFGASGAGTGGTAFRGVSQTTIASYSDLVEWGNRDLTNSQIGMLSAGAGAYAGVAAAHITGAIDTTAATEVAITGALTNSGESIVLEGYTVRLTRPDIT